VSLAIKTFNTEFAGTIIVSSEAGQFIYPWLKATPGKRNSIASPRLKIIDFILHSLIDVRN
jgi:hypothetical protein